MQIFLYKVILSEMSFQNLSLNKQYAIGGTATFPNQTKPYVNLNITNSKARNDQRASRKIEGFTVEEKRYRRLMKTKDPKKRRIYKSMIDNILRHQYDQSILASEHGQFPSLPKASVAGNKFPERGVRAVLKGSRMSRARIRQPLKNVFMPTHFQRLTDAQQTTSVLLLSGREQPGGGSEGSMSLYRLPLYVPNAAYGGSTQRYR